MSKVWFIRHGESVSNADLPTRHPALSELTPRGHREAEYVAQAFSQEPDLIVVSPYVRARETAVPTQKRFPKTPVVEWPVHEFTYLHPEKYNGTIGSERAPAARAYWQRNDPFEHEDGEGESFADLLARINVTKENLAAHPAEFVALFSHGLFLRAFIWSLLTGIREATPAAMRSYHQFVKGIWMENGAIFEGRFNDNGRISITGFDTSHIPPNAFL